MKFNWDDFLIRLQTHPSNYHKVLAPCTFQQIELVDNELGRLPTITREMLSRFNGAELFILGSASFSLFGLSTNPPLPPLEWAAEWCIDKFTPRWRAAGSNRQEDWAITMTGYVGLILLERGEFVKEWDTGENRWILKDMPFHEWIEKIISEGESIVAEV
jgi:hypothetical protein